MACRRWQRAERSRTPPIVTRTVSPRASGSTTPASGKRVSLTSDTAAENVAFGCATEDCVIRMWPKSGRAEGDTGRRYWVLELGN
jgi:hypothetical protein